MADVAYRLWNPLVPYVALRRHFALVYQISRRDVVGRYRGSFIGVLWSFFNPLLMLAIYTFVFGVIFKARWNTQITGHLEYAVMLFAGLNINQLFSECANRAPSLILQNTNFVKKVVFPLETLSWSTLGAGLFHLLVATIVLLLIGVFATHSIAPTVVAFPLVVVCFLPFVVGAVWLLASLGVFLRDLQQVMPVVTSALLFTAPILYPMSLIPEQYRHFLYLNPLTVVAVASQDTLVAGQWPNWVHLGWYLLGSCLFAWLAFAWFQKTRKGFADVV